MSIFAKNNQFEYGKDVQNFTIGTQQDIFDKIDNNKN